MTLYGQNVFAVGGRCGKQPVAAVESFDIELNQWTSWMNLTSPTALSSFGCSRGMMVVAGGLKVSQVRKEKLIDNQFFRQTTMASAKKYPSLTSRKKPRSLTGLGSDDGVFFNLGALAKLAPSMAGLSILAESTTVNHPGT